MPNKAGVKYDVEQIRKDIDCNRKYAVSFLVNVNRDGLTALLDDLKAAQEALRTARSYHAKECRCAVCPVLEKALKGVKS